MALLTIVTVVRNDPDGLRRTIESVHAQNAAPDQFLVLDGSDDRAVVPAILAQNPEDAEYAWAEPRGVYAAMNDALSRTRGEFVYFLNAGDVLASDDVLRTVASRIAHARPTWAIGRVRFRAMDGTPLPAPEWDYATERAALFARGRFPAHQGVVVRTDLLRAHGGFDPSYRVAADYAVILRFAKVEPPLQLDLTLAEFTVGGLSTQDWRRGLREFHRARRSVFAPTGSAAAIEAARTARTWLATSAYRSLWAPGRPLARVVARLRPTRALEPSR